MFKRLTDHLAQTYERSMFWLYADALLIGYLGYKVWGPWLGLFS